MSKPKILLLNGPNLNKLGTREPKIYGTDTLVDIIEELRSIFPQAIIDHHQSNLEGELVQMIQDAEGKYLGIVLNAGGYSHTSVALHDAIAAVKTPVVEVHLSNLLTREEFRHRSIIGAACNGSIMGLGKHGYRLAIDHLLGS